MEKIHFNLEGWPLLLAVFLLLAGCVTGEDFDSTSTCIPPQDITVDAKMFYASLGTGVNRVSEDLSLKLYVTSSDEENNIYGAIYLQDHPSEPTLGVLLKTGLQDAYLLYPRGTEVFLNLAGLYVRAYKGGLQVGSKQESFGNTTLGRIPNRITKEHLRVSCKPVRNIVAKLVRPDTLDRDYSYMFVSVAGVQVAPFDLCDSYAEPNNSAVRTLKTCDNGTVELLNSGYSAFSQVTLPSGNGHVEGMLTYSGSTPQILINRVGDLHLSDTRCDGFSYQCVPPQPNSTIREIKALYKGKPQILHDKTLKVTVIADPESGAFTDSFYIRDDTGAIRLSVEAEGAIPEGWRRGSTVCVHLDGLVVASDKGERVLAFPDGESWKPLPAQLGYFFVYPTDDDLVEPEPIEVAIEGLSSEDVGELVRVSNVQFGGSGMAHGNGYRAILANCSGNTLLAILKSQDGNPGLPEGEGNMSGILTYKDGFAIRPLQIDEMPVSEEASCDLLAGAEDANLDKIIEELSGSASWITSHQKVSGVVISDRDYGNFNPQELLLQAAGGSLLVSFDRAHTFDRGSLLEISMLGGFINTDQSFPTIRGLQLKQGRVLTPEAMPAPLHVTAEDLMRGDMEGKWVSVSPVQLVTPDLTLADKALLGDCKSMFPLRVLEGAAISRSLPGAGSGLVKGFMMAGHFYIGDPMDLTLNKDRMDCVEVVDSEGVFISELADPVNTSSGNNGRFVELYNASDAPIDISGWELRRYTNDNPEYTASTVIAFQNTVIEPHSALVIAANATHFQEIYGFSPHLHGGSATAADSNGDDNVVLVNALGEVVDVFGVPGEDGTATPRDFRDGRVLRRKEVVKGQFLFQAEDWEVYQGYEAMASDYLPHEAPGDYTPGSHH